MFKKAERHKAKLRLALSGTSGSGKTTGALLIAKGLGGRIAVLDTERGSASLYANIVDFDVVELSPPYTPERFTEIVIAAEKAGYDTLILDSITHEWKGAGGVLQIVEDLARSKFRGNSYAAWNEGTPRHQKFIDAMLHSNMHIICTMRSKAVYVESEKNGKKALTKEGAAPEQRDGLEYEFTVVLDIHLDGNLALPSKNRTPLFKDPFTITEQTGADLLEWLNSGSDLPPVAPPTQRQQAPQHPQLDLDHLGTTVGGIHNQDELTACWKGLGLPKDHPQYQGVVALFTTRKSQIEAMGDMAPPPPAKDDGPITDGQRKWLQTHYNGWDRPARLADASNGVGREIVSFNDLSTTEAHAVIEAIQAGTMGVRSAA